VSSPGGAVDQTAPAWRTEARTVTRGWWTIAKTPIEEELWSPVQECTFCAEGRTDPEKDEKARLKEALKLNEPLATVYYMKEDLRRFWEQPGKRFATTFVDGWIRRAETSGIQVLHQMARTLAAHRSGLLAYYVVMISSGPMEGTNKKIKTMKRQAYDFRDREFFKLRILAIHETSYELAG
jgi:transposase